MKISLKIFLFIKLIFHTQEHIIIFFNPSDSFNFELGLKLYKLTNELFLQLIKNFSNFFHQWI